MSATRVLSPLPLYFFPDFRAWNPYQALLYEGLSATPVADFDELIAICDSAASPPSIIHLHWLSPIVDIERAEAEPRVRALQAALTRALERGSRLVYTVHNIASHEGGNLDLERSMVTFLLQHASAVHVHHASVIEALQAQYGVVAARYVVAEHAPYRHAASADLSAVLEVFDAPRDAVVTVVPGQLRVYKNPEFLLEVLSKWAPPHPDVLVLFAGGVTPGVDRTLIQRLRRLPFVRFGKRLLDDAEFSVLVRHARAVWLSYREISTSGSLFHALSAGTSVIAPALGTIPFYVQPGVNGVLYAPGDAQTVRAALTDFATFDSTTLEAFRNGAHRSVAHLNWNAVREKLFSPLFGKESRSSPPAPESSKDRWLILDPGLRDTLSHHHALNQLLFARLTREQVTFDVLAHRSIGETPYGAKPTFEFSVYADSPALDEVPYQQLVRTYRRDLEAGLSLLEGEGAQTWVIHTATAAFLQALAAVLKEAVRLPKAVLIQLMFHPQAFVADLSHRDRAERRYALALRTLRAVERDRGVRVEFSSSCESFVQEFSKLSGARVVQHPLVLLAEDERASHSREASTPLVRAIGQEVLLYSGDLKLEKGAAWIIDSLPALLEQFPDVFFTVHWAPNRFDQPALRELGSRLLALAAKYSRLRVLRGSLSEHEWQRALCDASVMVLPYDPQTYAMRSSGIFWERLWRHRQPRGLVVTRGTWMEQEAKALDIEVGLCDFADTVSLVKSLAQALSSDKAPADPNISAIPCFSQGNDEFLWQASRSLVSPR